MINLDGKQNKGAHWVSLFIDKNRAVCFDSFEIEYIIQEVFSKIKGKSITHKVFLGRNKNNELISKEHKKRYVGI